jgi:formylglycine-generating enzyme required for sulfatase activity
VAHEAVLRQWPLINDALERERTNLACIQSVESAAKRWKSTMAQHSTSPERSGRPLADAVRRSAILNRGTVLEHAGRRLREAVRLVRKRSDYRERLDGTGLDYLTACRVAHRNRLLAIGAAIALIATAIEERQYVLLPAVWAAERYQPASRIIGQSDDAKALPDGSVFRECSDCPEMTIVQGGTFMMGSLPTEVGHDQNENPQHPVTIRRFAVGRFDVTFGEWEACARAGGCLGNPSPADGGFGRGRHPVVNVTWNDAQEYVAWLSRRTGRTYRLLTEAEWEYVARAGTTSTYYTGQTVYFWQANFDDRWARTLPVGSYPPNPWGLYDLAGNVNAWVQDCVSANYDKTPTDGSAWDEDRCIHRIIRGGSWSDPVVVLRSARRYDYNATNRNNDLGFRVARLLE